MDFHIDLLGYSKSRAEVEGYIWVLQAGMGRNVTSGRSEGRNVHGVEPEKVTINVVNPGKCLSTDRF